jgi:NAD(P)-dependent dehydrogenase (short-subunit alcohol dehydrogenase family)
VKPSNRVYVAGHRGLVGSAIVRKLAAEGYRDLVLRAHAELDLRRQADVEKFFAEERPEYVFLAAARAGGILANDTYRAISSATTCSSRRTSSTRRTEAALRSSSFSARRASTRSLRRSQLRRSTF